MGRDHTIFASERGYVRYYLDPERHPDRKFIGISFEKDGKLPTPKNAPTKRRLNKVLAPRLADKFATEPGAVVAGEPTGPQLRPGYMYREGNWQIGRAAEKAGIEVPAYKRDNRWLAWRRRKARHERTAQLKSLRGKSKKGGKKKKGKGRR